MKLRLSDEHALSIAVLGLVGLIFAVTADGQSHSFGRLTLDTVISGVPVAIALCLPYVRRKGLAGTSNHLLGPAALGFLAWGLLSVVANGGQLGSLLTMVRYASYFLLALVISVVAQEAPVRRILLWAIALSAGATSVLAFLQFKYPQLTPGMNGISSEISTRVVGTFYNSNFYAEYLLLAMGCVAALAFTSRGRGRALAILLGVACTVAMLLTYTRGSWIGLAIAVAIFSVVTDVRYLFAVAVAGAASLMAVPGVAARLAGSASNSSSADFRLGLWKAAGLAMESRPVFGFSPGEFLTAYKQVVTSRPELYQGYLVFGAHNAYFALAAETGVLGGILFFLATVSHATKAIFVATREGMDDERRYTALALGAVMIGFVFNTFTSNTFQHPQSALFFWILSGIAAAAGTGAWSAQPRALQRRPLRGVLAGSAATGWIVHLRDLVAEMWRASTTFSWTARARERATGAIGSSVVMRAIFGSGRDAVPERQ